MSKYYYPLHYKETHPGENAKPEFHKFVKTYAQKQYSFPMIKIVTNESDGRGHGLGFVIDHYKDNLVIVTCSHVITQSKYNNEFFHILDNPLLGSYSLQPLELVSLFNAKKINNDLAFAICRKPQYYTRAIHTWRREGRGGYLVGGYHLEITTSQWEFRTGCKMSSWSTVEGKQGDGAWLKSTRMIPHDQYGGSPAIYQQLDMLTKQGMSGGPVISKYGIEGMFTHGNISASDRYSFMLPIAQILNRYHTHIKPRL